MTDIEEDIKENKKKKLLVKTIEEINPDEEIEYDFVNTGVKIVNKKWEDEHLKWVK